MSVSNIIMGISSFYHDSSCCIIRDGKLVAAALEERFSRIKHDKNLPIQAFCFCMDKADVSINDIACIAYYGDPHEKRKRQTWMIENAKETQYNPTITSTFIDPVKEIREKLGYEGLIECVPHHLAHAASAYYFSGFREAAIFIADGVGEWSTTSYGHGVDKEINIFEDVRFPHSLGLLYSAITSYLGFEVNDGEYKVMGLAPYGNSKYLPQLRRLIRTKMKGQFELNLIYFDFIGGDKMYSEELCSLLQSPPRLPESDITEFACDVACSLQNLIEEVLLEKTRYLFERTGSENLCLAGSVALNCVANAKILKKGPFRNMFVQPASNDSGGALGAAALVYTRLIGKMDLSAPLQHVYLGPVYSNEEIVRLLTDMDLPFVEHKNEKQLLDIISQYLTKGKVIGWFQGCMEFGPRALGARSILADPRRPDIRDRVNRSIKRRESFPPFAPAVLSAKAHEHFDIDHCSPFMTEVCKVKSTFSLPAITHIDGTARIQTVDSRENNRFAALLEAFECLTGCPILLNTSFNLRCEPIVSSPLDALICFARSGIDYLVLESIVIDREDIPCWWFDWLEERMSYTQKRNISNSIYTFF